MNWSLGASGGAVRLLQPSQLIGPETLPLKSREVLAGASALCCSHRGGSTLAGRWQDFGADALRHGEYPCFGAGPAPHSHVGHVPLLLLSRRVSALSQRS